MVADGPWFSRLVAASNSVDVVQVAGRPDAILLATRDGDGTIAFYEDVLGFPLVFCNIEPEDGRSDMLRHMFFDMGRAELFTFAENMLLEFTALVREFNERDKAQKPIFSDNHSTPEFFEVFLGAERYAAMKAARLANA